MQGRSSHLSRLYRRAFALLGHQFTTPFLGVADGKGNFLSRLQLTLVASGHSLIDARWLEEHVYEEAPEHIELDVRCDVIYV